MKIGKIYFRHYSKKKSFLDQFTFIIHILLQGKRLQYKYNSRC